MNKIGKHSFGRVGCSSCTIEELIEVIKESLRASPREGFTINFINAHLFNLCWNDTILRENINRSDIVAADGMAIVWAARLFGFTIPSRCNMTDTFRAYLADNSAPASTSLLIGGTDEEASIAAAAIQKSGPHISITGTLSGFHKVSDYEALIMKSEKTDFIFIGAGSPKSEAIAEAARRIRPSSIVWHIGGGTIMFFAGSLIEAPEWMRNCGLQWLHRLLLEPGRMWKRYLIGNPLFVLRVLGSAIFHRRPSPKNMA